jgi:hypothetical protein
MSYLSVFVSIKIHISCVVINCINSGNKSFDDFSEPDETFLNVMDEM